MLQNLMKYIGPIQGLLGVGGAAGVANVLGSAAGGNIFNILSGAAFSYLGFKGSEKAQRTGALGIGGVNAIVGLLGAFGMNNIAGIALNESTLSWIVNLAIGAWGIISGLMKKK